MKFVSLFSGIGGFDWGAMLAGHECVGYVEIDKFAHQSFEILHDPEGRLWSAYDIRDVTDGAIRGLGQIPLIIGGFPCQSFSIAGKRQGFTDATRGTLFFEIIRFASILRPEHLLLENVAGLFSHDNGRTFETILCALEELGYVGEWQVHNSSSYVAQNRERIFIVASLRGSGGRKVFPFGRQDGGAIEVIGRLEGKGDDYIRRVYGVGGLSPALPTMQGGGQEPKVLVNINDGKLQQRNDFTSLDANYAKGLDNHGARTGVLEPRAVLTPDRLEKRQNGRRTKDPGKPMFTLTAQDLHGVQLGYRIRKLTPLECFRLQSYPDEWYVKLKLFRHPEYIPMIDMSRNDITDQVLNIIKENGLKEGISDSQLYKMAGNGVTSSVAADIASRLGDGRG